MRALVVACVVALACSPLSGQATPTPATAGERVLYLTDSFNGSGLIAIDPGTLKDTSLKPLLPIGWTSSNSFFTVASGDGRALAVVGYGGSTRTGEDIDIDVYDARSGAIRARFHPEEPVIVDALSADGSRIIARSWPPGELGAARVILDASNGHVVAREPRLTLGGELVAYAKDVDAIRLYALLAPDGPDATGPRPVDIAAWDLRTGTVLWRVPLPNVSAGRWRTGRTREGLPVMSEIVPALALSRDRARLAIVRTPAASGALAGGTLTLVDAASGATLSERTFELKASLLERLLSPAVAYAKSPFDGTWLSAAFSPAGERLYVWGRRTEVPERGEIVERYLGMVAIQMSDVTVTGTDIKMERGWYEDRMLWVRPSADGRALYLFLERTGEYADPKGYVLRRVDPITLRVLAERRFDRYQQAFLLAR